MMVLAANHWSSPTARVFAFEVFASCAWAWANMGGSRGSHLELAVPKFPPPFRATMEVRLEDVYLFLFGFFRPVS